MLLRFVASILDRDLRTLAREVAAYPDEQQLWKLVPGISNAGGTLALHLTGNIQHYLGARLGGTEYVRDRPAEFAQRDVTRAELLNEVESARAAVKAALAGLTEHDLDGEFPETISGARVSTGEYLIHLATHFAYHLGQVDYHRRVVTGSGAVMGAMKPEELSSARPTQNA
jgi:uncharacterized damage-inducible protein DinB